MHPYYVLALKYMPKRFLHLVHQVLQSLLPHHFHLFAYKACSVGIDSLCSGINCLSSFYFSSLQYLLLYFCFHFSFKFYLFCRLFCLPLLQIIFLLSSKAFSLPRSVLSSFNLTLQSSFPPRLFLLTFCFIFFSSILVTKATST